MSTQAEAEAFGSTGFHLPMPNRGRAGAAEMIASAMQGNLIPVIGFDAVLLDDPSSEQHIRLQKAARRLSELQSVEATSHDYENESEWVRHVADGADKDKIVSTRKELEKQVFKAYLPSLKNRLGWPFPERTPEEPPSDALRYPLVCLELKIAKLAVCLTRIWANDLTARPHPLDASRGGSPAGIDAKNRKDAPLAKTAWDYLVESVTQVDDLMTTLDPVPARVDSTRIRGTLALGEVRVKLLRLLVEVVGEDEEFWADRHEVFAAVHRKDLEQDDVHFGACCPDTDSLGIESGIRSDHLVWLESLLEHLLLAGTGAYRTHEQFGFALSLALPAPPTPVRRRETALVGQAWWSRRLHLSADEAASDSSRLVFDLLQECDRERGPSRFSLSIAALVQANHVAASGRADADALNGKSTTESSRVSPGLMDDSHDDLELDEDRPKVLDKLNTGQEGGGGTVEVDPRGWIVSTCLDLELEKALGLLGPYRVLLPARSTARANDRVWLIGSFPLNRDAPEVSPIHPDGGWHLVDTSSESLEIGDGPIIVKVYGSPLHRLDEESLVADDVRAIATTLSHRIVVGEEEFMQFFQGVLPQPPNAPKDLTQVLLEGRHVVFLGHDSRRWGDRAHYYGWGTHLHGRASGGRTRMLRAGPDLRCDAYGDTDALGGSLIEKHFTIQDTKLSDLASRLIKGFQQANPGNPLWL